MKSGDGINGDITSGVVPYSAVNSLAFPISPLLAGKTAAITVAYKKSDAISFDVNSFYYGCVLGTLENIVSAPIICKISVGGYDRTGRRVAFQQFTYTPPPLSLKSTMSKAVLDDNFKTLHHVAFVTTYDSVRQLGVSLMDNLDFTITANVSR